MPDALALAFASSSALFLPRPRAPLRARRKSRAPTVLALSPSRAVARSPQPSIPADLALPDQSDDYLLTFLAPDASPLALSAASAAVESLGGRLQRWRALAHAAAEAVVALPPAASADALRHLLHAAARTHGVDFVLQEASVARERKLLAVFDLDSTLIAQETIDELAAQVHVEDRVKAITERAMNGEIGFREALAARVALLEGLPLRALDGVKDRVVLTLGARRLVRALGRLGCRTAVVSGGFHFLADHVREELGLDYCFANRLEVDEHGVLTGRTVGEVVDGEFKESTLNRLAKELGLRREQVLAVGDGSNDLLMMKSAGLGVAFNAKPIVQDHAKARLNQPSLANVLYLLGLSDEDIEELLAVG